MRAVISLTLLSIILFGWLQFNFAMNSYNSAKLHELEKYPIIVFSSNTKILERLAEAANDSLYIAEIKLDRRADLSKRLMSKYSLNHASQYLDPSQLPDVLTITFRGAVASIEGRDKILKNIGRIGSDVVTRYNEKNWQIVVKDYQSVSKFVRIVNFTLIFCVFIIVFVIRLLHEKSVTESIRKHRKLYTKAGTGRFNLIAETAFYTVIPVSIVTFLYYYFVTEKSYPLILSRMQIIGVYLLYLVANSFTVIFADRNYD